jgi:hypothetical protein
VCVCVGGNGVAGLGISLEVTVAVREMVMGV